MVDLDEFDKFGKWAEPDRDRGILTEQDRRYLLGESDLEGQGERNARYRIRQRTKHALLDAMLLADQLSERDLRQVANSDELSEFLSLTALDVIRLVHKLYVQNDDITDVVSELEDTVSKAVREEVATKHSPDEGVESVLVSVDIEVTQEQVTPEMFAETIREMLGGYETPSTSMLVDGHMVGDVEQLRKEAREWMNDQDN